MVYTKRQELLYWTKQVACQIHYSFASNVQWQMFKKTKTKQKFHNTLVLIFFKPKAFYTALLCFLFIIPPVILSFKC